ncbi:MAG: hypothetical protein M3458_02945 [Acidobacteriota bacterium]|nr:hypothetical protein [Acidobacteriota bacterium]
MTDLNLKKEKKQKKKRTALVICQNGKQFWTTQTEFWQWVRDCVVVKTQDQPLTGVFRCEDEELKVLINHTVLNLGAPNHLREIMLSRQKAKIPRRTRMPGR